MVRKPSAGVAPASTAISVDAGSVARAAVLRELAVFGSDGWSVKPNCGGSSVSTFLLAAGADPAAAVDAVIATGDAALVEARVRGVETTCGVLGNAAAGARALGTAERDAPGDHDVVGDPEQGAQLGVDEALPHREDAAVAEGAGDVRRPAAREEHQPTQDPHPEPLSARRGHRRRRG